MQFAGNKSDLEHRRQVSHQVCGAAHKSRDHLRRYRELQRSTPCYSAPRCSTTQHAMLQRNTTRFNGMHRVATSYNAVEHVACEAAHENPPPSCGLGIHANRIACVLCVDLDGMGPTPGPEGTSLTWHRPRLQPAVLYCVAGGRGVCEAARSRFPRDLVQNSAECRGRTLSSADPPRPAPPDRARARWLLFALLWASDSAATAPSELSCAAGCAGVRRHSQEDL